MEGQRASRQHGAVQWTELVYLVLCYGRKSTSSFYYERLTAKNNIYVDILNHTKHLQLEKLYWASGNNWMNSNKWFGEMYAQRDAENGEKMVSNGI